MSGLDSRGVAEEKRGEGRLVSFPEGREGAINEDLTPSSEESLTPDKEELSGHPARGRIGKAWHAIRVPRGTFFHGKKKPPVEEKSPG